MLLYASLIFLPALLLAGAVRRIPEGQVYSLYRFGRPTRMLDAGIHMVWPLVDRVAHKISLSGRILELDSDDGGDHTAVATVYWQVLEPDRADAVIDQAEQRLRRTALQACADDSPRGDESAVARAARIKHALNADLRPQGILVTRVDLRA